MKEKNTESESMKSEVVEREETGGNDVDNRKGLWTEAQISLNVEKI